MKTPEADRFAEAWKQRDNPLDRATVVVDRTFRTSAEELFPLLCPTGELDWIPGWTCDLLHADSGRVERNCIFRTSFAGPVETWICTRYEPFRAIDYTRTSEHLASLMEIRLVDHLDGTVSGRWVLTAWALDVEGNAMVAELDTFGRQIGMVLDGLIHFVDTGEMVPQPTGAHR